MLLHRQVIMSLLNWALGRAASCRTNAFRRSTRYFSSAAGQTSEKSVPYTKTLKEESTQSRGPTKALPKSADVVVIGGGSLGCQTTYHLAKLGIKNVVLLERDRLTSGTTWHTAGLLWQLRPSDVEVELLAHTRNVVSRDLEEETGLHTGWIQNGGLFIASNKQRLDEYKRLMSLGKVYGVESYVLSPAETKDLYPLMNVDDLYGTLYVPTDGTMDPAGTCTTLARAASTRGALIIENCPVTGIQVHTDDFGVRQVSAVETEHGTIQTSCLVNCAGVWARTLGQMAGVNVPLVAMHHAYVVTERIEGIQISLRCRRNCRQITAVVGILHSTRGDSDFMQRASATASCKASLIHLVTLRSSPRYKKEGPAPLAYLKVHASRLAVQTASLPEAPA